MNLSVVTDDEPRFAERLRKRRKFRGKGFGPIAIPEARAMTITRQPEVMAGAREEPLRTLDRAGDLLASGEGIAVFDCLDKTLGRQIV